MELLKLNLTEFRKIAKFVYERTGIDLPESKVTLLSNRLRKRLRELKLDSFDAYYALLCDTARCEEELPHFLSAVTTNETYFFRNESLWKFFRSEWIPEIVERKKASKMIRIWSAASSSGEEAYTAAMCLREDLPNFSTWNIRVIASDISQRVLDRAKLGEFNDYSVSKMPEALRKKWFVTTGDKHVLKDELRRLVSFRFHNLRDPFPDANFDLVFLRNVLMYFDTPMKLKVLETVTRALVPGGKLIVGDVNPLRNTPELNAALELDYCGSNVYEKPGLKTVAVGGAVKG